MRKNRKLKIFSLEVINLSDKQKEQMLDEFDKQWIEKPNLPFYGLCYKNSRPTILVSKKEFSSSKNKEYYAQLIGENT
jgi:hypothetical protein